MNGRARRLPGRVGLTTERISSSSGCTRRYWGADSKQATCNAEFIGGGGSQTHIGFVPAPPTARPQGRPRLTRPTCRGRPFDVNVAGKTTMKLTIIALASVLAVTSSMALAQGAGGAEGGGTGGAVGSSSVGRSTGTGTTGMSNGNATAGSSNSLSSGFSTGTYPTLVTPGGMPSSVPAPGATISR